MSWRGAGDSAVNYGCTHKGELHTSFAQKQGYGVTVVSIYASVSKSQLGDAIQGSRASSLPRRHMGSQSCAWAISNLTAWCPVGRWFSRPVVKLPCRDGQVQVSGQWTLIKHQLQGSGPVRGQL